MSPDSSGPRHRVKDLEILFHQTFFERFNTRLESGKEEPLYVPQSENGDAAVIYSTRNYYASALHEISHWCIAGDARRKLEDYGYWYEPDGRSEEQQSEFEKVEAKPQALECLFSCAAGTRFRLSADNANSPNSLPSDAFAKAVFTQYQNYLDEGLPPRAAMFFNCLQKFYGTSEVINFSDLTLKDLS